MTKRRSIPFKVSKPASPALEKAITECVSEMKRRKVVVNVVSVQMVVKNLVSEGCKEAEVIDGIKDLANTGKLRVGSSKRPRNSPKPAKTFGERTINLPTQDKANQSTETESKDEKEE